MVVVILETRAGGQESDWLPFPSAIGGLRAGGEADTHSLPPQELLCPFEGLRLGVKYADTCSTLWWTLLWGDSQTVLLCWDGLGEAMGGGESWGGA